MRQTNGSPLQIADFSPEAQNRALQKEVRYHPLTLYPLAVSILGGVAMALFHPTLLSFIAIVAGVSCGTGNYIVNYFFRGESIKRRYLETLHRELVENKEHLIQNLEENLKHLDCARGVDQFHSFREKYENFIALLRDKMNEGELAYQRYLGIAEQVYLSGLDNLSQVAAALQSVATIFEPAIESRLREIHGDTIPDEKQEGEIDALVKRKTLHHTQTEKVEEFLSQNEKALTTLDETAAAIANVRTRQGYAEVDIESAMQELQRMAERAHVYSINP